MTGAGPSTPGPTGTDRPSLADSPEWAAARTAQVLSVDYARTGPDGELTGVYSPVPVVHPPGWCDHLDTICTACLTAWTEDNAVALFRHGTHGARIGCRCPVCRTCLPTTAGDQPARPDAAPSRTNACLPDIGGHHRHLTINAATRFAVVTIPAPGECPYPRGNLDCRTDDPDAVAPELLAVTADVLLADPSTRWMSRHASEGPGVGGRPGAAGDGER